MAFIMKPDTRVTIPLLLLAAAVLWATPFAWMAVASLRPGQSFVLLVPFEPAPLFGKLGARGLSHQSELQPDGSYRIEFTPGGPVLSGEAATASCGCGGH